MSRSYFSRCFRDIAGKTFNDFVREVRVNHAKNMLVQTGKSIGWIATQAGYPNEKYFSKVFRELTGMLPGEFRKNQS
ncbi:Bifunctional transcriptional activator/DNA repair enzyme AdaA [compost metagenome]